jgi:hypothetical protein
VWVHDNFPFISLLETEAGENKVSSCFYDFEFLSSNSSNPVRFQVITAVSVKMTAFWDIAPRSLVEVNRRFRGAYCLHHQGDE